MDATTFNVALFERRCEELGATTNEQKATLAGVNWTTIHRFSKGQLSPRLAVARQIAGNLGVDVDELWPTAEQVA